MINNSSLGNPQSTNALQAGFSEGGVLNHIHGPSLLPGVSRVISHGYPEDEHGNRIKRVNSLGKTQERYRIAFADYGRPLDTCRSVYEFLRVMHDALA
ncbi:hypothetical protein FRC08_000200, partial [Ceratobasidium sp. 394]